MDGALCGAADPLQAGKRRTQRAFGLFRIKRGTAVGCRDRQALRRAGRGIEPAELRFFGNRRRHRATAAAGVAGGAANGMREAWPGKMTTGSIESPGVAGSSIRTKGLRGAGAATLRSEA